MRIKNETSLIKIKDIIINAAVLTILLLIATIIFHLAFYWVLFYVVVIIVLVINWLQQRKKYIDFNNKCEMQEIEYADFQEGYVTFEYENKNSNISIPYTDITCMDLCFHISIDNTRYGKKTYLSGVNIEIYSGENVFLIYNSFFNIYQIYKIICFTKLGENLHCKFKGNGLYTEAGKKLKAEISKNIDTVIKNDYKMTFFIKLTTLFKIILPIMLIIILIIIIFCMLVPTPLNNDIFKLISEIYKNYAYIIDTGYGY